MGCARACLFPPTMLCVLAAVAAEVPPEWRDTPAPPAALVNLITRANPSLSEFVRYARAPIDQTYALDTFYASTGTTQFIDENEARMTTGLMCAAVFENDTPIIMLDTLVAETKSRRGAYRNRGYRVDRISSEQVTFLIDDDFYGTWEGKVKLFFDLNAKKNLGKQELGFFAVHTVVVHEDVLWGSASYSGTNVSGSAFQCLLRVPLAPAVTPEWIRTIDGNAIPALLHAVATDDGVVMTGPEHVCTLRGDTWTIEERRVKPNSIRVAIPSPEILQQEELDLDHAMAADCLPEGSRFMVAPGGVVIIDAAGPPTVYPMVNFDYALLREKRHDPQIARNPSIKFELQNFIGAWQRVGQEIVFGNDFYDGEGLSGIGALGYFDLVTREYRFEFLDEMSMWSTAALVVDGNMVWIALARQPEGKKYSGGILRYNRRDKSVARYELPHVAIAMVKHGDSIVVGTEDGLYVVERAGLTRIGATVDLDGAPTLYREVVPR